MVNNMFPFDNYIFIITGMSYIIDSSGTSKAVKAHQHIFNDNRIGTVTIFPITKSLEKAGKNITYISGCFGLTVNGSFIQVLTCSDVICFLKGLESSSVKCKGILVHHLIRNNIEYIDRIINSIHNVPIIFYLHDFYTCCVNPQLLKNKQQPCRDCYRDCDECYFKKSNAKHLVVIHKFFKDIENRTTFVAPAKYTLDRWLKFYPKYKEHSLVIGHLKPSGVYTGNSRILSSNDKIRIAFVGAQKDIKGWDKYKDVVKSVSAKTDQYHFYYFGNGDEQVAQIQNVYVDTNSQGEHAMTDALRIQRIDIVLFVCVWGETYSYTMYESHAANCFLIARETGGNIPISVQQNQWGLVYKNEEELCNILLDTNRIKQGVNHYRECTSGSIPMEYTDNDEILKCFDESNISTISDKFYKPRRWSQLKAHILNYIFVHKKLKQT